MSIFSKIRSKRPPKNKFNLSHERKFSFQMGKLTPILVQDVVPGDKFRVNSEIFLRMAPMLAPIMHRVNVFTHYFFVPNRLVWDEWEDFITGGREGTSEPVAPVISAGNTNLATRMGVGSLWDYMGLPVMNSAAPVNHYVSALPFRAYQLIYNEYYRDQNLMEELNISKASGNITAPSQLQLLTQLRTRAWEKDYFTSALPWAQRGGDVSLPFESEINYKDNSEVISSLTGNPTFNNNQLGVTSAQLGSLRANDGTLGNDGYPVRIENIEDITSGSVTINELRRSVRLQEWLEKNARGGARYVEQILSHFGVRSSDARLQRPEYLGGGKQPVQISEVLSTFQEATGNPQGNMSGHGVAVGGKNGFKRFFEEHGYVIGLMSVLPKTAYQQGIPRHFSRSDRFDYYWPEFAQIGEQEIKNKELYLDVASEENSDATFGYQSRYAEYKYAPSTVHGEMRDSLAFWHMGRIFNTAPALNSSFVSADPTTRIFAVEDQEHMYCQLYNKVDAIRPMPYFGTPTL